MSKRRAKDRNIKVVTERRDQPDLGRLARVLIALAMAEEVPETAVKSQSSSEAGEESAA